MSQPEIDVTQIEEGKNFIFTATVAVRPEVTLGTYKGVEIAKVSAEVTDEDIDAEVKKVQWSRMQESSMLRTDLFRIRTIQLSISKAS